MPSRTARAPLGRWLITLMVIGFVALMIAALAIVWVSGQNQRYTDLVLHTQDVRQQIADAQVQLEQSETARRGYVLTGQPLFRDAYVRITAGLPSRIATLRRLTIDNPDETRRIDQISARLGTLDALRRRSIALVDAGQAPAAAALFRNDQSVLVTRAIRARLGAMTAQETGLLAARSASQQASTRSFYAIITVAAVLVALVAIVSLLTVLRNLSELTASRDELHRLNMTLEDQVAERTADLTRANEEIQRFAYIVSHDLRSPLVNVMGFTAELDAATKPLAELIERADERAPDIVTEEARDAATTDLPEAIGFIRTSTQKMDRLINAILRLSREGRRVLTPEPLDIAAMIVGITATLQHRIDEEGAEVSVEGALPTITSDRLGIEQIFSNLVENALKYTAAGRPARIVVRGLTAGQRAIFEVEDNGRGIDPRDHARVFDLFRRSGAQDRPGEGIGLAHVRALAYRLGGTIDVRSELGRGATFRLSLPLAMTDQQDRTA